MDIKITVIGLDRVGISLGLAIKKKNPSIDCVGFDIDPAHSRQAMDLQAFTRTESNLHKAIENADMVVLNCLPVDVTGWMDDINRSLKPGAVLISLTPVHSEASKWAAAHLAAGRSFVNAFISLNGRFLDDDNCSDELFNDGTMLLSTNAGTDEVAVQKILDLAAILGLNPMFSDPIEADGLVSQSDLFPRLVNLMLLQELISKPGWSDAQKVTGPVFWNLSKLLFDFSSGDAAVYEIQAHKQNMIQLLDSLRDRVDRFQDILEKDNNEELKKTVQQMLIEHNIWMTRRKTGKWDASEAEDEAKPKGIMQKLFGINVPVKKK